ncbi:hypothetical protein Lser_V15G17254 [Lactuca serriola]
MSSNAASSSNEVPGSNSERPWMTKEVLVLTRCWLSVKDGVSLLVPPHCLIGDEWTRITSLFNHEMGEGQKREKSDVVTKWMDVKEEVTWFNRACNYAKSNNVRYCHTPKTKGGNISGVDSMLSIKSNAHSK